MTYKPTYVILNLSEIWLCESPRDKLRCDPNNILRPVEMCPDARARLFTACLCYNFKENTIKNIIIASAKCTSLHSLKSLVFKPSPPHRVHLSELFFVQGWMAFSVRWRRIFGARRLVSFCENPRIQLHCGLNNISRPVEMCPDARVPVLQIQSKCHKSKAWLKNSYKLLVDLQVLCVIYRMSSCSSTTWW